MNKFSLSLEITIMFGIASLLSNRIPIIVRLLLIVKLAQHALLVQMALPVDRNRLNFYVSNLCVLNKVCFKHMKHIRLTNNFSCCKLANAQSTARSAELEHFPESPAFKYRDDVLLIIKSNERSRTHTFSCTNS